MREHDERPIRTINHKNFDLVYANEVQLAATNCDYQMTFLVATGDEQGKIIVRQMCVVIPHELRRSMTESMVRYEQAQGPEDSDRVQ